MCIEESDKSILRWGNALIALFDDTAVDKEFFREFGFWHHKLNNILHNNNIIIKSSVDESIVKSPKIKNKLLCTARSYDTKQHGYYCLACVKFGKNLNFVDWQCDKIIEIFIPFTELKGDSQQMKILSILCLKYRIWRIPTVLRACYDWRWKN